MARGWDDISEEVDRLSVLSPKDREFELDRISQVDPCFAEELRSLINLDSNSVTLGITPIDAWGSSRHHDASIQTGRRIGPYEIRRILGRGGNGTVYLANRVEDYQQLVALKVLHAHFDDIAMARFRIEIQTLARLVHPNIVRLMDGGTTETGLPYFVMEYVEGEKLDEYCDRHEASIERRVELVAQIGKAIAYAHEHNVLHRDLKPANVLVTHDGTPKLIDFGFAHLLHPEDIGKLTADNVVIGTPGYMSPEQIRADVGPIGPATDCFGLGAILYRLIAGKPPFSDFASIESYANAVLEKSPLLRKSNPAVPCDLETIVDKAIARKPADRFASMGSFIEQLQHFLADEPLTIYPPTLADRLEKWTIRHRRAVLVWGAVSAVVLSVVFGTLVTSNIRVARALAQAREQTKVANDSLNIVRETLKQSTLAVEFMVERIPLGSEESHARLTEMVRTCEKAMAQIPGGDRDEDLRFRAGLTHHQLAKSFEARDTEANRSRTLFHFDRAVELFEGLVNEEQDSRETEASSRAESVSSGVNEVPKDQAADPQRKKWHRYNLFRSLYSRAYVNYAMQRAEKALADARSALEVIESLARDYPNEPEWTDAVAFQHITLAGFLGIGKDSVEAKSREAREALRIASELAEKYPDRPYFLVNVRRAFEVLSDQAILERSWDEAEKFTRNAIRHSEKIMAAISIDPDVARSHALLQGRLAEILARKGAAEEAETLFASAIATSEKLAKEHPQSDVYLLHPLQLGVQQARFLYETGRHEEAAVHFVRLIERYEAILAERPLVMTARDELVSIYETCPVIELRNEERAKIFRNRTVDP